MSTSRAITRYLRTGNHDPYFFDWSSDVIERERRGHEDLKRALVDEVSRCATGRRPSSEMLTIDLMAFTRAKVEPMMRGLFPTKTHRRDNSGATSRVRSAAGGGSSACARYCSAHRSPNRADMLCEGGQQRVPAPDAADGASVVALIPALPHDEQREPHV